jgi:uncharacterized protein YidB (DUF937 family)
MGLLDDLLGQLAGGGTGSLGSTANPPPPRGGGAGMEKIMLALVPVVLAMMARGRQGGAAPGFGRSGSSGGLGDILGQVLGGGSGGSGSLGGLGGLLEQFQRAGFGDQASSWVSTGRNQPLPPDALEQVFGRGGLAEIARRAGVSEGDASRGLSQLLPEMVDRMTPDGQMPDDSSLDASVDSLAKRFGLA